MSSAKLGIFIAGTAAGASTAVVSRDLSLLRRTPADLKIEKLVSERLFFEAPRFNRSKDKVVGEVCFGRASLSPCGSLVFRK